MTEEIERERQEGLEFDEILRLLRERGFSKGESVAVLAGLRELGPLPGAFAKAKTLALERPVWADEIAHQVLR